MSPARLSPPRGGGDDRLGSRAYDRRDFDMYGSYLQGGGKAATVSLQQRRHCLLAYQEQRMTMRR